MTNKRININDNDYKKLSDIERKIIAKANNSVDTYVYFLGAAEALDIAGIEVTEQFEAVYNLVQQDWFESRK